MASKRRTRSDRPKSEAGSDHAVSGTRIHKIRELWKENKIVGTLVALGFAILGLYAVWNSLPDKVKEGILSSGVDLTAVNTAANAIDVAGLHLYGAAASAEDSTSARDNLSVFEVTLPLAEAALTRARASAERVDRAVLEKWDIAVQQLTTMNRTVGLAIKTADAGAPAEQQAQLQRAIMASADKIIRALFEVLKERVPREVWKTENPRNYIALPTWVLYRSTLVRRVELARQLSRLRRNNASAEQIDAAEKQLNDFTVDDLAK